VGATEFLLRKAAQAGVIPRTIAKESRGR
jgi:hypothetical protein